MKKQSAGRRVRREKIRRKKMQVREKVGKSRNTVFFFRGFVAPEGWKVGSLKRRVRSPAGQMRDEKVHAVVALSTFASQNVQNTPASEHFWKLRCRKSARRCGAKHVCKSKCTKHTSVGALLEVEMSKKCTVLWREAHLEVKSVKNWAVSGHFWKLRCRKSARRCGAKHISKSKVLKTERSRSTFGSWDVEKVHGVVARSTFRSQKC